MVNNESSRFLRSQPNTVIGKQTESEIEENPNRRRNHAMEHIKDRTAVDNGLKKWGGLVDAIPEFDLAKLSDGESHVLPIPDLYKLSSHDLQVIYRYLLQSYLQYPNVISLYQALFVYSIYQLSQGMSTEKLFPQLKDILKAHGFGEEFLTDKRFLSHLYNEDGWVQYSELEPQQIRDILKEYMKFAQLTESNFAEMLEKIVRLLTISTDESV
jgi:hypothetical protein